MKVTANYEPRNVIGYTFQLTPLECHHLKALVHRALDTTMHDTGGILTCGRAFTKAIEDSTNWS